MQGIKNPALSGVRREPRPSHTRGAREINQHKKKETRLAPEQVARSVNMFLGEWFVSEAHLFFCLFIQPIFLKDPDPMWEQDTPCAFKELIVNILFVV